MSVYGERAKALFERGYNCSQSVVLAFCEPLGLDMETMAKLASSFGGGMGRLREVCGAISGMLMIVGLAKAIVRRMTEKVRFNNTPEYRNSPLHFKGTTAAFSAGIFWGFLSIPRLRYRKNARRSITRPAPVGNLILSRSRIDRARTRSFLIFVKTP